MRGRLALGVVAMCALLLGISSLGLNPPRSRPDQFGTSTPTPGAATDTPTNTATSVAPTDTPIPPSTATSTIPATAPPGGPQPTRRPRPEGPPATPSIGIKVNACARVVWPQGLSLADGPGLNFGHVQIVGLDDVVFVIDGPQRGDGLWWWKVTTRGGVVGWGINDHLAPFRGECFGLAGGGAPTLSAPPTPLPAAVAGVAVATSTGQGQLPATGSYDGGLIFAGVLVIVLLVVGLIRRRNQGTI